VLEAGTISRLAAQTRVRRLIWDFYADLGAYRLKPSRRRAAALRARFDRIFLRRTGFATPDRLPRAAACQQAAVADDAGFAGGPAPNNGSENDIRCYVTRRKASAGTRCDAGRYCRDAFLGLIKTCDNFGIAVSDYPGGRLNVAGHMGGSACGGAHGWFSRSTVMSARGSGPPDGGRAKRFAPIPLE
jgi:hypothetical protein